MDAARPLGDQDDPDSRGVFLNEEDAVQETAVVDQEVPVAEEGDPGSDARDELRDDSVRIFTGHTGELYCVSCSPLDASLVATGGDEKGFLWRVDDGNYVFDLNGHKDSISSLAFSADAKFLATGSFDGTIQVWDISTSSIRCVLDGPGGGIEWVTWHPSEHLILAGSEDASGWMWNAGNHSLLGIFSGHGRTVTCGDFTPDGKTICTGSDDASLRIWNAQTGESIHAVRGHPYHSVGLTCLATTPDSSFVITGAKDGSLHIVNILTGEVVNSLVTHSDSIECIGLPSCFPWAATGGRDGKLIIWDLQHVFRRCICDHEEEVTCLSWLGPSQFVATGSVDGKLRIWDSASGECVKTFHGHGDTIESIAVCEDAESVVSVSRDRTARVFDISEFK